VQDKLPGVRRFIQGLRMLLSSRPRRGPVWGRYPPESRYNLDQVPLPVIGTDANKSYEHAGAKVVWIRACGSGVEKRFASLPVRTPFYSLFLPCYTLHITLLGPGRKLPHFDKLNHLLPLCPVPRSYVSAERRRQTCALWGTCGPRNRAYASSFAAR
jgi:hypothetical protein